MLPDISVRLNNLIKAMEKTIIPAIGADEGLALEQAQLLIGHLKMLDQQWDKVYLYERGSYDNMRCLAANLCRLAEGGEATREAKVSLLRALEAVPDVLPLTASDINALTLSLGQAVDHMIAAAYRDATDGSRRLISEQVLDYGKLQASRERVWFSANGLDPDGKGLESFERLFDQGVYQIQALDSAD